MKKNNVKVLSVCSLLSALFVGLELIAMHTGLLTFGNNYQIPISCFPLILASVMFGPAWGTATALVGAFLSQVISYGLNWNSLLWMVPTVIYALCVALLYLIFKKNENPILLGFEFAISSIVLSVLNTSVSFLCNYIADLSNALLKIFLPFKLIMALVFAVLFAVIVPPIIKRLRKVIKF